MTCAPLSPMPEAAGFRRDAAEVMRLDRLGAAHLTRLSFLRVLLRRLGNERWRFDRPVFDLDGAGVGRAVYRAIGPERTYSLVAFGHDLPAEERSDRVIATAWDATFALFDGTPDAGDLDRLAANVPVQEAGRVTAKELSLSRANRSVRFFEHVVQRLSEGRQPDPGETLATGYLMRTSAVYGSGKFGAASHCAIATRPELSAPFQAEMLSVWLTRAFTVDLVEHMAQCRGGSSAAALDPDLRRTLGVGNATGLGMAPFLMRQPLLLNNWVMAREEALARVRAQKTAGTSELAGFKAALQAARENAEHWRSAHPVQMARLEDLRSGLHQIGQFVTDGWNCELSHPWDTLWRWGAGTLPLEAQEALLALLLEPHGALVDDLAGCMSADESAVFAIDGGMTIGELGDVLACNYDWAFGRDCGRPADEPVARLLLETPDHRPMVRRAQMSVGRPFAEIRDNLISADLLLIDMLRCKMAFFGATRFDPRSDQWVRISLYQGAPYPDELSGEADL